jgi:hypothetical protein
MKKTILIDTSSAILLFKSDWMAPLMEHYRVGTGPTAFREMTVPDHPGAGEFARWQEEHRLLLHAPKGSPLATATALNRLDPGERECISLYYGGAGTFIIIDDGPGAAFCRRSAIPYVNALLIPRLLNPHAAIADAPLAAAIQTIYASGRYAPWVLEYALTCPAEDLTFFLP